MPFKDSYDEPNNEYRNAGYRSPLYFEIRNSIFDILLFYIPDLFLSIKTTEYPSWSALYKNRFKPEA